MDVTRHAAAAQTGTRRALYGGALVLFGVLVAAVRAARMIMFTASYMIARVIVALV